jgi:hypothetical protein
MNLLIRSSIAACAAVCAATVFATPPSWAQEPATVAAVSPAVQACPAAPRLAAAIVAEDTP